LRTGWLKPTNHDWVSLCLVFRCIIKSIGLQVIIPLFIIIVVAITVTKATILQNNGFWQMLTDSCTDWSMLLGSIFLLIKGGGKWSAAAGYTK
jgi:uncharacterized protein involved in cysteine biosynthesis